MPQEDTKHAISLRLTGRSGPLRVNLNCVKANNIVRQNMRTATRKHLSVHDGIPRFAQVTVALLDSEEERIHDAGLFFGDRRIERPSEIGRALLDAAIRVVCEEERKRGVLLCVTKVESAEVDAHPEAARLAALSAVDELIEP